jgi:hypothetical protein
MAAFARAIKMADNPDSDYEYIVTSINECQPPSEKIRKASDRSPDEGREGYTYRILRWPAFVSTPPLPLPPANPTQLFVLAWLGWLAYTTHLGCSNRQFVLRRSADIRKLHRVLYHLVLGP